MISIGNATTQTNGANRSHANKFGSVLSHRTMDQTSNEIKGLQQLLAHMQQQQQQEPQQAEPPMRAVTSRGQVAQPAAHNGHSVGRRSEALTARPQVRSFIDPHFDRRIVFDRKNSIQRLFFDRTICFDRRSMSQVLAPSQPQSAPQPTQQVTQLAQPPLAPRGDPNLVDLPPFDKYLSDHVLASVFSEFQLSRAYQRFVADEAWPTADDAICATTSLLYVTARWAWQRIIPKSESASHRPNHPNHIAHSPFLLPKCTDFFYFCFIFEALSQLFLTRKLTSNETKSNHLIRSFDRNKKLGSKLNFRSKEPPLEPPPSD